MAKSLIAPGAIALLLGLAACSDPYDPGQRAVGGGLLGAGAGAAIGGLAGGGDGCFGRGFGGGGGWRGGRGGDTPGRFPAIVLSAARLPASAAALSLLIAVSV